MRQHNSGAVKDFILPYSALYLRIQNWKNYWNRSTFSKIIVKIKVAPFFNGPRCSSVTSIYSYTLFKMPATSVLQCHTRQIYDG